MKRAAVELQNPRKSQRADAFGEMMSTVMLDLRLLQFRFCRGSFKKSVVPDLQQLSVQNLGAPLQQLES